MSGYKPSPLSKMIHCIPNIGKFRHAWISMVLPLAVILLLICLCKCCKKKCKHPCEEPCPDPCKKPCPPRCRLTLRRNTRPRCQKKECQNWFANNRICQYFNRNKQCILKCAVCLSLGLMLLEVALHVSILINMPTTKLSSDHFAKNSNLRAITASLNRSIPSPDTDPEDLPDGYTREMLDDFMEWRKKLVDILKTIEHPGIQSRSVFPPAKQRLILYEWLRFLVSMTAWTVMLMKTLYRMWDCTYHSCCFTMIMMMALMLGTGYLSSFAVAIADACQNPDAAFKGMADQKEQRSYLKKHNEQLCRAWELEMKSKIMEFRKTALDAKRYAIHRYLQSKVANESDNFFIYSDTPSKHYHIGERSDYAKKFINYFDMQGKRTDLKANCKQGGGDPLVEDAKQMCKNDRVLGWVLYLLLMEFLGLLLFLAMLAACMCCRKKVKLCPKKIKCCRFLKCCRVVKPWCGECNRRKKVCPGDINRSSAAHLRSFGIDAKPKRLIPKGVDVYLPVKRTCKTTTRKQTCCTTSCSKMATCSTTPCS